MKYTTNALPGSQMQITIPISADTIRTHYTAAVKSAVANFSMDGFRPGAVPEKIVIQKVGTLRLWEEALREAIPSVYIEILTESKIPAIGRPHFSITKIADQSDAEVVVTTTILPEFTMPDYASIAKEVYTSAQPESVTDEKLETALLELRRLRHKRDTKQPDEAAAEAPEVEIPESELPELTPEYLSGFGTGITDIDTLKSKMRHNLEHEAIHQFEDKKRAELTAKLIDATPFEVPQLLVDHEINLMLRQYEHDLSMSGISLDDYLKYTNKTREDLRTDVAEGAARRAKIQLIIEKLSEETGIIADPVRVATDLKDLKMQYKDNKDFDESHAKSYLEQVYGNQAVFAHLEHLGGYKSHNHEEWSKQ